MNRTQKRIVGWTLIAIGVIMLLGAAVNSWPYRWTERDWGYYRQTGMALHSREDYGVLFKKLPVNPFFYLGLISGAVGMAVLKGDGPEVKK